jgi:hypothetical protein
LGRGRWLKEVFVGVGVVGDGAIPSRFWASIVMDELTGRKVEAMACDVGGLSIQRKFNFVGNRAGSNRGLGGGKPGIAEAGISRRTEKGYEVAPRRMSPDG